MANEYAIERTDAFEHPSVRHPMWLGEHAVFLGLVALAAAQSIDESDHPVAVGVGAAALVGWYALGVLSARMLHTKASTLFWLTVLTALWAALLVGSPQFTWVAFPLFLLYVLLLPPGIALPAVGVVTVGVVAVQLSSNTDGAAARALGPVIGAGVAILLGLNLRLLSRESHRRRLLIEELVRTQQDLVATHDELARVQREAGALAERERLAREIHDTLAQGLTSILLLLRESRRTIDAATGHSAGGDTQLDASLAECERLVGENLEEARRVVQALSPASLDHTPLSDALERLTRRLGDQTAGSVQYTTEGDPIALPTAHEVTLLRVAQSALANVRQHADADKVAVTLSYLPDSVTLDVVDDGIGFDPARIERATAERTGFGHAGFGLRAMRGRLADLGGTLAIESTPGEGTAVAAAIPLTALTALTPLTAVTAVTAPGRPS